MYFRLTEFARGLRDWVLSWKITYDHRALIRELRAATPIYALSLVVSLYYMNLLTYLSGVQWAFVWFMWTVFWALPMHAVRAALAVQTEYKLENIVLSLKRSNQSNALPSHNAVENLYGLVLAICFLIQSELVTSIASGLIPHAQIARLVAFVISVVHYSWAAAFSAFECRLITKRRDLFQRVQLSEEHWGYALGYGLPLSLVYHVLPSGVATIVWQYGVLLMMLGAMKLTLTELPLPEAELQPSSSPIVPRRRPRRISDHPYRWRIFYLSEVLTSQLVTRGLRIVSQKTQ
jgi:hypothetical protein